MCKTDPEKGIVVVSAPKGTALEVDEEGKGECSLRMNSNGKGDIKVYSVKLNEGVR